MTQFQDSASAAHTNLYSTPIVERGLIKCFYPTLSPSRRRPTFLTRLKSRLTSFASFLIARAMLVIVCLILVVEVGLFFLLPLYYQLTL